MEEMIYQANVIHSFLTIFIPFTKLADGHLQTHFGADR